MLVYDKTTQPGAYGYVCPVTAANALIARLDGLSQDTWPLYEAQMTAELDKMELVAAIEKQRDRAERMLQQVDDHVFSPNSLGEDQGAGANVDRLCALFARSGRELTKYLVKHYPEQFAERNT